MSTLHQKLLLFPAVLGLAVSCGGEPEPSPSQEHASVGQPLATCEAVSRVVDLYPGINGSSSRSYRSHAGALYFSATAPVVGDELWKTDGTAAGTVMVKEIYPGPGSPTPGVRPLGELNGTLFLSATDGVTGTELWKTDGTAAGTVLVKDIYPGTGNSDVVGLGVVNGALLLAAYDATHGKELWRTDGTAAGTFMVKDIYGTCARSKCPASSGSSDITDFILLPSGVGLFLATDGINGKELWRTDGTAAGTYMVKDIYPGASSSIIISFAVLLNGVVYFPASDGVHGYELWRSDGTAAGTYMVKDINPGTGTTLTRVHLLNGTLFFSANDGVHGNELWKSDGTSAGTVLVHDHPAGALSPGAMMALGSEVLFIARPTGAINEELWKTDGTSAGTVLLSDPNANRVLDNCGFYCPAAVNFIASLGGTVYFNADDGLSGYELWKTDGTPAGTGLVRDLNPGIADGFPVGAVNAAVHNGSLFFTAYDSVAGGEPWMLSQQACP